MLGSTAENGEHTVTTITQNTALWYASRATGVVSMLLLSLVVILGIMVNRQGRLPGLPRVDKAGQIVPPPGFGPTAVRQATKKRHG